MIDFVRAAKLIYKDSDDEDREPSGKAEWSTAYHRGTDPAPVYQNLSGGGRLFGPGVANPGIYDSWGGFAPSGDGQTDEGNSQKTDQDLNPGPGSEVRPLSPDEAHGIIKVINNLPKTPQINLEVRALSDALNNKIDEIAAQNDYYRRANEALMKGEDPPSFSGNDPESSGTQGGGGSSGGGNDGSTPSGPSSSRDGVGSSGGGGDGGGAWSGGNTMTN